MRPLFVVLLLLGLQFSKRVDVVRVDVLVTRDRAPMRDLSVADFEVRDNGVLQTLDYAGFDDVALNVVLALDMSHSVEGQPLAELREAGHAVLDALKSADRGGLVLFGTAVAPSRELTAQRSELHRMLDGQATRGQTSLMDATFAGLMLGSSEAGRSLLLTFTDGADTASWLTEDAVIDAAKRSDVVVYGVVTASARRTGFLRDIASATGGSVLEITSTSDLKGQFLRLLEEYRLRYLLSYTPRGVARDGWHRLDVKVKRPFATVKARPGYQNR
jgi:tight adherence protein B